MNFFAGSNAKESKECHINLSHVFKKFDSNVILKDVNLEIYRGEIFAIVGMSGCGKSTLLKHMIGSIKPDSGSVFVFGSDINNIASGKFELIKKKCAMLFQFGALFDSMTIFDNVSLPLVEHTDFEPKIIEAIVQNKLELVGLKGFELFMPGELSGGMKKRVALARSLVLDPEIIFYDEPTSGLDPIGAAAISKLINDLSKKLSVTSVVVSHDMNSVFKIADRIAMLHDGNIIEVDATDKVKNSKHPVVRQFIDGVVEGPIEFYKDVTYVSHDKVRV